MVSSLDGYVASMDNSVSWFDTTDHYEAGVDLSEDDAAEFLKKIDCYVMGSHTYEHAWKLSGSHGWVYGDVPTIVLTHRELPISKPNIESYSGDLKKLVDEKLKTKYKNVWLVGGTELVKSFMLSDLADEIVYSILPVILGNGLPFFDQIGKEKALHLKNTTAYKSGLVELCYEIKK